MFRSLKRNKCKVVAWIMILAMAGILFLKKEATNKILSSTLCEHYSQSNRTDVDFIFSKISKTMKLKVTFKEKDINPEVISASVLMVNKNRCNVSYSLTKAPVSHYRQSPRRASSGEPSKELLHFLSVTKNEHHFKQNDKFLCMMFNLGRQGNQMYQYASLYGISKHAGLIPLCDNRLLKRLKDAFTLPPSPCYNISHTSKVCSGFEPRSDATHGRWDWMPINVLQERPKTNVVYGMVYLQTWMYFYDYVDEILQHFKIKIELREKANKFLLDESKSLRSIIRVEETERLTYVGVHVRHGDVMMIGRTNMGYMSPTLKYYQHAMEYFLERYLNVAFIVTTDHLSYAQEEFAKLEKKYKIPIAISVSNSASLDFAILASCNHTIMSVGTYGVWVSQLVGGDTIYYDIPVQPGSDAGKAYSKHKSDYYTPYMMPYI